MKYWLIFQFPWGFFVDLLLKFDARLPWYIIVYLVLVNIQWKNIIFPWDCHIAGHVIVEMFSAMARGNRTSASPQNCWFKESGRGQELLRWGNSELSQDQDIVLCFWRCIMLPCAPLLTPDWSCNFDSQVWERSLNEGIASSVVKVCQPPSLPLFYFGHHFWYVQGLLLIYVNIGVTSLIHFKAMKLYLVQWV